MEMSWANSSKQSNADILRAGDIMPPYNDKSDQESNLRKVKGDSKNPSSPRQKQKHSSEKIVPPHTEENVPAEAVPAEFTDANQQKREIPRFDLAEEILAEQRKITAIRRKAPGPTREVGASKKDEPPLLSSDRKTRGQERQVRSIDYAIEQPMPLLSEQQQIIAEIVARDIEGLCSGIASVDSF